MKRTTLQKALCSAVSIPQGDGVPEWIHLLPAGAVRTNDGRGPYTVKSLQAVADASFAVADKLALDECHSTDRAAPLGISAPARGWIVGMEVRGDGLWGRVEWTPTGHQLMSEKAYAGISPVIFHTQAGEIVRIARASLTNAPNLPGLVALHSEENHMDFRALLIELLGLDGEADDAAIEAALKAKMTAPVQSEHSQNLLQHPTVMALQSQLSEVTTQLNTLQETGRRGAATAFVDAAIAQGRVGVKPMRDEYIALHMENPARAEQLIGAMPAVGSAVVVAPGADVAKPGELTQSDRQVIALMGLDEGEYRARLEATGQKKEAL